MIFKKIYFFIILIQLVICTKKQKNLIEDDCLNPILLISTINGRIHAIKIDDSTENLNILWSLDTERLLSSSIDKLELYNDDNSLMRIIPSLDGNLFAYYPAKTGHVASTNDHLEKIPFNLDDLLKTSIKLNNKITIIGGILTTTLGIDVRNGQLIYNCSSNGCDTSTVTSKLKIENNDENDENLNNLLVIKQSKNLLRAISIENGVEKWNISLVKNEIIKYPMCNRNLEDKNNDFERINHIKSQLRFNVSKGSIKYRLSSLNNKMRNFNLINLNNPIVTCDLLYNGVLKPIDIFSTKQQNDLNSNNNNNGLVQFSSNKIMKPASVRSSLNSIYIGRYETQFYAQNTRIEEDEDNNDRDDIYRKNNFRKIIENKDQLLKTKSTRNNNLAISTTETTAKTKNQHNSVALFNKRNNFEAFLSSAVVREQKKTDKDYDDNVEEEDADDDDIDYENNQSYSLLVPDESLLLFGGLNEPDFLFINKNLNNYIYMISSYKELINVMLNLFAIVFSVLFLVKIIRAKREPLRFNSLIEHQQVLISPPSNNNMLTHQYSSTKTTNSSSIWNLSLNDVDFQKATAASDTDSDDDESESSKSRYLSEFNHQRLIGKGGFGYVFEAVHKIDERVFAIKRIRLKNRKDARDKVLREVRTLAKLESPYIVRYFHSWFEKHSYEWQRKIDKEKLLKENGGGFIDELIGGTNSLFSQFSETTNSIMQSNTNTNETATDTRSNFKINYKNKNKFRNNNDNDNTSSSASSSIVFEEDENEEGDDDKLTDNKNEVDWNEDEEEEEEEKIPVKKIDNEALYIYIQMELCQRETLRHWLDRFKNENRGRLQIFTIFEQILNAITYIHSQDLIHRDLKPSNIFLSLDGKMIKIGDFGLVVSAEQQIDDEDDSSNSIEHSNKKKSRKSNDGTYLYMSPEQLNGLDYDYKVDIYSIGVILFELIVSFSTQMERIDSLKKLNKGIFPVNFENNIQ